MWADTTPPTDTSVIPNSLGALYNSPIRLLSCWSECGGSPAKHHSSKPIPTSMSLSHNTLDSLPREPSEYRRTKHLVNRFRTRRNPEITGDVIRTCITEGDIQPAKGDARCKFVANVDGYTWWLVVQIVHDAFENPDVKHLALTAYSPGVHGDHSSQSLDSYK